MSFCDELAADIAKVCGENGSKASVEQEVVLFPLSAITAITKANGVISAITLSAAGYKIDGIHEMIRFQSSFVRPENGLPGYIHRLNNVPILDPSAEARESLNKIATGGGNYVAVIERKAKGTDKEDAFIVLGLENGLSVQTDGANEDSEENDGMFILNMSSKEKLRESRVPSVLLLTDYATTKTAFGNKFAPA